MHASPYLCSNEDGLKEHPSHFAVLERLLGRVEPNSERNLKRRREFRAQRQDQYGVTAQKDNESMTG